ncbi:MAG: valine--tRNA ligase [Anaerolineales bacterium]|nr:valine--tRNA ligase [Anaerolineales bacterium]
MTQYDLPKAYDFKSTEPRIYEMWEKGGYFKPSNDPQRADFDPAKKPFVISIPPPNVTGELHLGHAMFVSMEDLMIRYHRMKGIPALWLPGSDHAGIATQLQVEKDLLRVEEVTREELGREKFIQRAWTWKVKYHSIIGNQIRRLGASCDWERERFTLDDGLSRAVREAFVRLYEKGLIYRGPRLVNWSPGLKTAVSDLEVEYSEEDVTLYYFKYMLKPSEGSEPSEGYIPVATIRPETILGDTAVAVHPEDERYKKYIGRKVIVPRLGREILVIADDYVSREFGTGALKVTPGHDPNDYAIAQRHNLPILSVLDEAARVTASGGPYQGQDRFECRKNLWADMAAAGLVIKTEPYRTTIPRSERGGEIVEPMISTQWFVKIAPLAEAALAAVKDGRIRIVPERFEKIYYNWLDNIKDWCISRQLWWGHRIPVWYCAECGKETCARQDPLKCAHCDSARIEQDPDVLDTWFSSGLWPFSTLGWPDETPDYKYFYPTAIMETGYDILFFWVARMIMMGLEFTGQIPFHTIYLHGLIRDENGQKMSKSKGNVIDPLPVMDDFGTDALRFTLLVGSTPGNDVNMDIKKVEANRNFANKMWNVGRFVIAALTSLADSGQWTVDGGSKTVNGEGAVYGQPSTVWTLADSWIWARLQALIREVERLFQTFQYGEAGRQIYDFFWSEFADWYVEVAKLQMQGAESREQTIVTLARVQDMCLRLLHPFTPFVTEELWGHLRTATRNLAQSAVEGSQLATLAQDWPDALIIAPWPEPREAEGWEEDKIADFTLVQDIVRAIRNARAEKKVSPAKRIPATIAGGAKTDLLKEQSNVIAALAGLDYSLLSILDSLPAKPKNSIALVIGAVEIHLPLAGMVDESVERERLTRELAEVESHVARLEKLLSSDFADKAPAPVVAKEREKLSAFKETAEKLKGQFKR